MAHAGFERFWGREITLNGKSYEVKPYIIEDKDGMSINLEYSGAKSLLEYKASHNSIGKRWSMLGVGARVYYQPGAFSAPQRALRADMDFMVVSAHEIGHTLLLEAFGRDFSWKHKGTSTFDGERVTATPLASEVKSGGEYDLMKYYKGLDHATKFNYSKASEDDVKGFIYKAARD